MNDWDPYEANLIGLELVQKLDGEPLQRANERLAAFQIQLGRFEPDSKERSLFFGERFFECPKIKLKKRFEKSK